MICRSLLQRVIPEELAGEGREIDSAAGTQYVQGFYLRDAARGINFAVGFGLLERIRDATGFQGADVFGRCWN